MAGTAVFAAADLSSRGPAARAGFQGAPRARVPARTVRVRDLSALLRKCIDSICPGQARSCCSPARYRGVRARPESREPPGARQQANRGPRPTLRGASPDGSAKPPSRGTASTRRRPRHPRPDDSCLPGRPRHVQAERRTATHRGQAAPHHTGVAHAYVTTSPRRRASSWGPGVPRGDADRGGPRPRGPGAPQRLQAHRWVLLGSRGGAHMATGRSTRRSPGP